ncbi:MAG TPA: response regulator, partial [Candidatus Polarisedimenticolia bacterium]|nr:response regulator [Candidatus Polarisedimenticolia bacterium]
MTTATILLAGETKILADLSRLLSERAACEVVRAVTGSEALRLLTDRAPRLILLDAETLGMPAEEACRRIREISACRKIPVLVVTPKRSTVEAATLAQAGCTEAVAGRVTAEGLLDRVMSHLEITRRVHVRTRVSLEVMVGVSGERLATLGYSSDISEGGMRVDVTEPLEAGATVDLSLTLPGGRRLATR